ncbi:hypothetical protein BGZ82_007917 [Podila clonocystis]|nr:hypothetical protein BGZ82_007917 [Podila clonocystis]
MVAPALMDQQQRRSSSALESKSANRHSLPVQRTRTKSIHLPSFSNTHPLVMATPSPSSPPSSPILEAAKKRPRPPLVISMPPSQNNDLTRSITASTASSTPSVLHRVKRSISRTIKSGRVADKPDASSHESHVKLNPVSPSSITSPALSSKRSSITSLPPLSPSSSTSPRTSSISIHHQHPHHSHYLYQTRQSISLDPISEEPLGETKKSGKLKRWQSKSSAKLKKWLHIDSPSKSPSDHDDNTTITPTTRRDSATTCSSCVSHEDLRNSSIGSSPNTSMPPSPALSARSVLSSFSSRPTSLPSPALQAITPPPPPPPPARRSSLRATSRSEGRPVSTPGRIPPRSSSLRVSVGSRSPPGRIPPRSSSLPRSYRTSLKRRSLLGRTLSTEIPPVPESPEEASFYAALAQVAAEVDEAIAAATEESESESTCSVRSRSSETLLLSEDEQVAHAKQVGIPRSALSPYIVSPETNVPIPWSCSDVLLDRPTLEFQDIEAMEEVQPTYVHEIDVSVQDIALPEKPECVSDITLAPRPPKSELADASIITPQDVSVSDDSVYQEEDNKEAHSSSAAFEVALSLPSDNKEEILDLQVASIMAEAEQADLLEVQQVDNTGDVEGNCAGELGADNVDEEVQVLSLKVAPLEETTPKVTSKEDSVVEVMEEKQDEAVATAPCEPKTILPSIHDIAQQLIDEIASNPIIVEKDAPEEEVPEPILAAIVEEEKDQKAVVDTEVAHEETALEDQVEQEVMVQKSLPESVLDVIDDYTMPTDQGETKEEEAIVDTMEELQVMDDATEESVQEVVPVVEEEIAMADVVLEPTDSTAIETLMEEPEPIAQGLVKETGPIDEPLTTDIVIKTDMKEETKEDLVEEAIEIASMDELAIVVSYEDPCQDMASSTVEPYQATSPLPSPEFRPVQVDDDLDIAPLVLSTADVTPEPTNEGSVVIQEDTQPAHVPTSVATKGIVWEALQELHPPAVSPWKRASRSPWLSASFWLHGQ